MRAIFLATILMISGVAFGQNQLKANIGHVNDGRFQLVQLSDMRRDQFLIDTQTGQIWERSCFVVHPTDNSSCQYGAWIKADVEGVNINMPQILKKAEVVKK